MAVNKYRPHLFVIPEDDANRQIAIGFEKDDRIRARSLQVVAPVGGWNKALEKLTNDYFEILNSNANSHVLVIIDCDSEVSRIENALAKIPSALRDRVFILGTLTEPEDLKQALNITFEKVGHRFANQCFDAEETIWQHDQLRHNITELLRVKSILFNIVFDHD